MLFKFKKKMGFLEKQAASSETDNMAPVTHVKPGFEGSLVYVPSIDIKVLINIEGEYSS